MYKSIINSLLFILTLSINPLILAENEANTEKNSQFFYFEFPSEITTNFYTKGKSIGYIQLRVELVAKAAEELAELQKNEPLIRSTIIDFLGRQNEATITSVDERDKMRGEMKAKIKEALILKTGKSQLLDLLFTKYFYQI